MGGSPWPLFDIINYGVVADGPEGFHKPAPTGLWIRHQPLAEHLPAGHLHPRTQAVCLNYADLVFRDQLQPKIIPIWGHTRAQTKLTRSV